MRKSKKEIAYENKLAWATAVREGRVVSYNGGERFRAFASVAEAEHEVALLRDQMPCAIARPVLVGVS